MRLPPTRFERLGRPVAGRKHDPGEQYSSRGLAVILLPSAKQGAIHVAPEDPSENFTDVALPVRAFQLSKTLIPGFHGARFRVALRGERSWRTKKNGLNGGWQPSFRPTWWEHRG